MALFSFGPIMKKPASDSSTSCTGMAGSGESPRPQEALILICGSWQDRIRFDLYFSSNFFFS